jgi:hypothetical protein
MKNNIETSFNLLENFPETYIYNNFQLDSNREKIRLGIDIDHIVYELIQSANNKEQFEDVMDGLKKEIMGEAEISDIEDEDSPRRNSRKYSHKRSSNSHMYNPSEKNHNMVFPQQKNNHNNKSFLKSNSVQQNKSDYPSSQYASDNFEKEQRYLKSHSLFDVNHKEYNQNVLFKQYDTAIREQNLHQQQQQQPINYSNSKGIIHKKYTDVHANTKYYYPGQDNSYDNDDLSLDQSQWTDRANRNLLYNTGSTFFNLGSSARLKSPQDSFFQPNQQVDNFSNFQMQHSFINNAKYKDNTNASILKRNYNKF